MFNKELIISWENAQDQLLQWHQERASEVGRRVFSFLEEELRQMIPHLVRQTWPSELIEDTLRDFLINLIENPLNGEINNLRAYLRRSFGNYCIDCYRAQTKLSIVYLEDQPCDWEFTSDTQSSLERILISEAETKLHNAMTELSMQDRIALKLESVPEWLSDEEVQWLAERANLEPTHVWEAIRSAADTHDLTRIFDPGEDDPANPELRRDRMERFRQRRTRARKKLRELLKEDVQ